MNDLQECRNTMRGNIDNSAKTYLTSHQEEGKARPTKAAIVEEGSVKPPKIMKQPLNPICKQSVENDFMRSVAKFHVQWGSKIV